jgi:small subunit ribosomal protein S18
MKRERGRRTRRKVCSFCVDKVEEIDYKDVAKLAVILLNAAKFCPVVFPVTVLNINAK